MHLYIRQLHRTIATLSQFEDILVDAGLRAQRTRVERVDIDQDDQTVRYHHDFFEIKNSDGGEDILLSLWLDIAPVDHEGVASEMNVELRLFVNADKELYERQQGRGEEDCDSVSIEFDGLQGVFHFTAPNGNSRMKKLIPLLPKRKRVHPSMEEILGGHVLSSEEVSATARLLVRYAFELANIPFPEKDQKN